MKALGELHHFYLLFRYRGFSCGRESFMLAFCLSVFLCGKNGKLCVSCIYSIFPLWFVTEKLLFEFYIGLVSCGKNMRNSSIASQHNNDNSENGICTCTHVGIEM